MNESEDSGMSWAGEKACGPLLHSFDVLLAALAASLVDSLDIDSSLTELLHLLQALRSRHHDAMIAIEGLVDSPVEMGKLFALSEHHVRRLLGKSGLVVSPSTGPGRRRFPPP